MSDYFGPDNCALEECFTKRYGGAPEELRRVYLLLRRDRLADDGRMRCVAATGDPVVAEQWRAGGEGGDGRRWEAVPLCSDLDEVIHAAGD